MSGYSGTPLAKKLGIGADTGVIHLFATRHAWPQLPERRRRAPGAAGGGRR